MGREPPFARIVSLACHDLRTPLATVNGFARTLQRSPALADTEARYVDMIVAAAGQIGVLLEALGLAATIEGGRYEPRVIETDPAELAAAAVEALGADRVVVSGEGAPVLADVEPARRAVSDLARCALRHGGLERVEIRLRGPVLELTPVTPASAPVLTGREVRDLGAAVAGIALRAMGGTVEVDGEVLRIILSAAS